MPRQLRETRFTIIELLWVIVIIGIMVGMGVAAMSGIGTHKGAEGGARMMARMLELSRQYAITENTRVALMMPMDSTNYNKYTEFLPNESSNISSVVNATTGTPDESDAYGVVLRPAIVTGSGSTYTFVRWVNDTKWEMLPQTVYFDKKWS